MTIALRSAVIVDHAAICDLIEAAYRPWVARLGQEPGPLLDDYRARITAGQVTLAHLDGRLAALIVLEPAGDDLMLDNVAVAPWAQGKGLGGHLMRWAETQAGACTAIQLYTHRDMTENQSLYRRLGYSETHRATLNGRPRVYMRKALR